MIERQGPELGLPLLIQSRHWGQNIEELKNAIHTNLFGADIRLLGEKKNTVEGYLAVAETEYLSVSYIRFGSGVQIQCQHDNVYAIVIPLTGDHCIRYDQQPFRNSRVHVLPPNSDLDMVYSGDCGHLVLRFPNAPFHESIFEPLLRDSTAAQRNAINDAIYTDCMLFMQDCDYATDHEKIVDYTKELQQNIYDVLLDQRNQTRRSTASQNGPIEQIVRYIDEHPNWKYSINELSHLMGAPVRTLYSQFQRKTGTSPYRYYQNRKLCRARLDLLRYGLRFSISEIATLNGFDHLGRFASQYRSVFGELPNETLLQHSPA